MQRINKFLVVSIVLGLSGCMQLEQPNAKSEGWHTEKPVEEWIDQLLAEKLSPDEGLSESAQAVILYSDEAVPPLMQAVRRISAARRGDGTGLDHGLPNLVEVFIQIDEPALPALTEALNDPSVRMRVQAAYYLAYYYQVNSNPAKDVMLAKLFAEALSADDRVAAIGAVVNLDHMGPRATVAVDQLIVAAQQEDDPGLRRGAIMALGSIGTAAKAALPVVRAATKDSNSRLSAAAREALAKITAE